MSVDYAGDKWQVGGEIWTAVDVLSLTRNEYSVTIAVGGCSAFMVAAIG